MILSYHNASSLPESPGNRENLRVREPGMQSLPMSLADPDRLDQARELAEQESKAEKVGLWQDKNQQPDRSRSFPSSTVCPGWQE